MFIAHLVFRWCTITLIVAKILYHIPTLIVDTAILMLRYHRHNHQKPALSPKSLATNHKERAQHPRNTSHTHSEQLQCCITLAISVPHPPSPASPQLDLSNLYSSRPCLHVEKNGMIPSTSTCTSPLMRWVSYSKSALFPLQISQLPSKTQLLAETATAEILTV